MFTLVPSNFFDASLEREALAQVAEVEKGDSVGHIDIPQYDAVLIYSIDAGGISTGPGPICDILKSLPDCTEYNKILCSIEDRQLYIAIAQGKSLLLANAYKVQDFTTAEYYIFLALKSLQLNPEVSTICWMSDLDAEDEMSLYRYFKAVVRL